ASAWRASYRFNHSLQDNRQLGRENADRITNAQALSVGRTVSQSFDVNLDASVDRQTSRDLGQHNSLQRVGGSFTWRPTSLTSIASNVATTVSADRPRTQRGDNTEVRAELAQSLPLGRRGEQGAGPRAQAFLRYARQSLVSLAFTDPVVAALRRSSGSWTLASGLNLKLF